MDDPWASIGVEVAQGRQALAVRGPGDRTDGSRMTGVGQQQCAGGGIPQLGDVGGGLLGVIEVEPGGGQGLSIRRPGDLVYLLGSLQGEPGLAGARIPDAGGVVKGTGD